MEISWTYQNSEFVKITFISLASNAYINYNKIINKKILILSIKKKEPCCNPIETKQLKTHKGCKIPHQLRDRQVVRKQPGW